MKAKLNKDTKKMIASSIRHSPIAYVKKRIQRRVRLMTILGLVNIELLYSKKIAFSLPNAANVSGEHARA
jgi:hypothetical protein